MSNNLAKSSAILIIFTLASKVLVVIRDMAMAAVFGASSMSDAYITATTILSLVSVAALSAVVVAYIPIISGKDDKKLTYITNNFMTVLSALTLLLSVVALLFTREIVLLFASGFSDETIAQTQLVLHIVLPLLFFNVILNIAVAYLQYRGSFWYQGFSAVIANGIIIVSVLLCGRSLKILAVGYTMSIVMPAIIGLILAQRAGLRPKIEYSLKGPYLRELMVLSIPIFASQILIQLNIMIDKNFASQLGTGIVTNLDYAHKIANILIATFVPSIATVLYPIMAHQAANSDTTGLSHTMERGLRLATLLSFPMMAGTILLSQPIVNLLFLRGSYSVEAAGVTAQSLVFYAIGMLPMGLIYILNNSFFSMKDTKTPLFCGAFAIVLNILLNFVLVRIWAYCGLAIATSIASFLNAILYLIWMKKKLGNIWIKGFLLSFGKIAVATILMSGAILTIRPLIMVWLKRGGAWELLGCIILTVLGIGVYSGSCFLLKENTATEILIIFQRKLKKII